MAKSRAVRESATTFSRLRQAHPDAHCELGHEGAFQLVVATILSAQATDVSVNRVTPGLFAKYPDAQSLAEASLEDVQACINKIGMFRQKAKNITKTAKMLVDKHGGRVPSTLDELVELPGVGRKTANVVLGVAYGSPEGVVVDTHVQRISQRLGWTKNTTPEKIERDLMKLFPRSDWDPLSHTLIFHGRRICAAQKPACAACSLTDACPSAFRAENVGRKPPRQRGKPAKKKGSKKKLAKKKAAKKKAPSTKKAASKKSTTGKKVARQKRTNSIARGKSAAGAR